MSLIPTVIVISSVNTYYYYCHPRGCVIVRITFVPTTSATPLQQEATLLRAELRQADLEIQVPFNCLPISTHRSKPVWDMKHSIIIESQLWSLKLWMLFYVSSIVASWHHEPSSMCQGWFEACHQPLLAKTYHSIDQYQPFWTITVLSRHSPLLIYERLWSISDVFFRDFAQNWEAILANTDR